MRRNQTAKVFAFTFRQMCGTKSWLLSTIIVSAALLIGIPVLFVVSIRSLAPKESESAQLRTVLLCDETPGQTDTPVSTASGRYAEITYERFENLNGAVSALADYDPDKTLILRVTRDGDAYLLTALLPERSELSRLDASIFADSFARDIFPAMLARKAQLSEETAALLTAPIETQTRLLEPDTESSGEPSAGENAAETLLPYLMLLFLYTTVVFYGQSMANSVLLEKNSKLMETMLTAVTPFPLIGGKLLACAASAVLQILIWIAGAGMGCVFGALIGVAVMPAGVMDTADASQIADTVMRSGTHISLPGVFLALLVTVLGLLLYLALAAVCGALASKTEDLGKTNLTFLIVLIASLLLTLSPHSEGLISDALWLELFPFTSVLVLPGRLILGKVSGGVTALALLFLALGAALLTGAAALIYRLLALYRGNPPSLSALCKMLRGERKKDV